ncbi:hypothetical protein LWI28_010962 [Acer negundo]|uniref:RING-type E3 ubiquitin transferase n=1 Tax=Acer negundo TaxID=4023 RepID=A0AAD5IQN1_ACENE|nr:hypothetical protein LWI28_010962 [Acer negundo]KAK4844343.1 hypothetical protein QYF36_019096 [Acer negundo]
MRSEPVVVSNNETMLSSTATPTCSPETCRWRPYSNSNDFETNAILILVILFCALICALALNAAIRCFLGGHQQRSPDRLPQQQLEDRKPSLQAAAAQLVIAPTLLYSAGMKLPGAVAECAICLSEFIEGDTIQVLGRCKHGFHVQCIQQWLSSHHSCPTCRCTCLADHPPSPSMESTTISQTGSN